MQRRFGGGGDPLSFVSGRNKSVLVEGEILQEELCTLLESEVGVSDRTTFVARAAHIEQLRFSRPLARFLHFSASHNARPDPESPGLLTRANVHASSELEVLNVKSWQSERYRTVEHVAPVAGHGEVWDRSIYTEANVSSLGNTVLLPPMANNLIGNATWERKIIFYRALMAKTSPEREEQIRLAEASGLRFTNRIKSLMESEERLPILDPLEHIVEWTADVVHARTRNILELAWDQFSPWLYE